VYFIEIFKQERKTFHPSIFYWFVGLALSAFLIIVSCTSSLFPFFLAFYDDDKISLRGPLASIFGFPANYGDNIPFRVIMFIVAIISSTSIGAGFSLYFIASIVYLYIYEFWLSLLGNCSVQNLRVRNAYRILTIVRQEFISFAGNTISMFFLVGFVVLMVSLFGVFKRYHALPLAGYLILPGLATITLCVVVGFIPLAGTIHTRSSALVTTWKNLPDKHKRTFALSCRPLTMNAAPFFIIKSTTVVTFMRFASDQTINLLISYK